MSEIDDNDAAGVDEAEDAQTNAAARPVVTYALIAVCLIVFYAMYKFGNGNIGVDVVTQFGGKDNARIHAGQWWRFVTPIFLHGGWTHVAVNCYSLYLLGGSMERIYGSRKYFIILIVAGISGNVVSFLHSTVPSLGASGAIAGLVGAGLVFPMRYRSLIRPEARHQILRQLLTVLVINGAIGFELRSMIDNWAHMGGLIGGGAVALFLMPDVLDIEPRNRSAEVALWASCAALLGLVFVSAFMQYRWATSDVTYELRGTDIDIHVSLPVTWLQERDASGLPFWSGPKAELLFVEDRTGDPKISGFVDSLKGSKQPTVRIGGYTAWQINSESKDRSAVNVTYVVPISDNNVFVSIAYPASSASVAISELPHILKGIKLALLPRPAAQTDPHPSAPQ